MNLSGCTLLAATAETGTWYRAIDPQHWPTALQTSHTVLDPSRFNPGPHVNPHFETLYLAVLSRRPRQSESRYLLEHLERRIGELDEKAAYSEILWGLINSPEFVLSK